MSITLSVLAWHTITSNFGALDASRAIIVVCAASAFLSLFMLGAYMFSLAEMAVLAAAFPLGFFLIMGKGGIAAFLAFLFFLHAAMVMQFQIRNRIAVRFYPLALYGVPAAVTALAVLFAFMGYAYPFHINGSLQIPAIAVRPVMPFVESFIASQMPAYTKGMTVDEFLSANAAETLKQKYGSASFANKQTQAAVAEAVKKQRGDFSRQFDVSLRGDERAEDILLLVADKRVNSYLVSYKEFVPLALAASVFVAVKSVGFLIGRIAVFAAWLFAHVLLAFGAIEKKKEQAERETLSA